jgi:regulation of enolase protein 1 (concanavalin A-like superfamily)
MTELGPATGPLAIEPVWHNEPQRWRWSGGELTLSVDPGTEFWRHTHYGFARDTGHFLGTRKSGEFAADVEIQAAVAVDRDQAGLMVRLDAERWVRCGLERVDGSAAMSSVVTHGVSDWSVSTLEGTPTWLAVRVVRRGDCLAIDYAVDGGNWRVHRMAYLPPGLRAYVGPMAVSPHGQGFDVRLRGWSLRAI